MCHTRIGLWVLCFALLSLVAGAREQTLLSTSNDKDSRVETFVVDTDDKGVLIRLWQRGASQPDRGFTLAQLKKGVVLKRESDKEVIRFRAVQVDPARGGTFRMDYLYSGVPPEEYKSLTLELKRKDGKWALFTRGDERALKTLHFKTNVASFMGVKKVIGIRSIEFGREG